MFRFDEVMERWATLYKPMQHNPSAQAAPEEKAFFLIDRFSLENEWTRVFNLLRKPCVCYATNVDAKVGKDPKTYVQHYGFYLMAKQPESANYLTDDRGAAETKVDLQEMVLDLLAWLSAEKAKAEADTTLSKDERNGWKGLQLDEMAWWSTPRQKNGWWVLGVELDGIQPRPTCVNPELYFDDTTI